MSSEEARGSLRSTGFQLVLFALAVVASGAVVANYPDPEAPEDEPPPEHFINIEASLISIEAETSKNVTSPAVGLDVLFFAWGRQGPLAKIEAQAKTNTSGLALVRLDTGRFDVQVGDWAKETIDVTKNGTLRIRRITTDEPPASLRVLALSRSWDISASDLIEAKYKNAKDRAVHLESVILEGAELQSSECGVGQPAEGADEYLALAGPCEIETDIEAFGDWSNKFRVPAGISIPWHLARDSINLVLRLAFTEVKLDS